MARRTGVDSAAAPPSWNMVGGARLPWLVFRPAATVSVVQNIRKRKVFVKVLVCHAHC